VPSEPLVLPEYRPTLPDIARRRFGWRERTTIVLLLAVGALIAAAVLLVRPQVDPLTKYVHHDAPVFNLLYDNRALHEVTARGDEIVRLQGKQGRMSGAIAVSPLALPAATGDIAHGVLPAYASTHIQELQAELPRFELINEGRARVNGAPGYEIRFRSGRTFGNDLLILPSEEDADGALLVTARRTLGGRPGKAERKFNNRLADAYRSFKYGTAAK
jgi:hypothetical protein